MGGLGSIILIGAIIYFVYIIIKKRGIIPYNKGIKLINSKNYADGIASLEKAVEIGVGPIQEITAAYAELKFGDEKKAETKINMVLLNPKIPRNMKNEAKCVLAIINLNRGNYEGAREIMDKIYEEHKTTRFYATYGYIAILSGDNEFMEKINEEAYEYNSDNPVICDNYGLYLYIKGDYEKSCEIYDKLLEKERNFPEVYYNFGRTLVKKGDLKRAKEMFEKALSLEWFGVTTVKKEAVIEEYNALA